MTRAPRAAAATCLPCLPTASHPSFLDTRAGSDPTAGPECGSRHWLGTRTVKSLPSSSPLPQLLSSSSRVGVALWGLLSVCSGPTYREEGTKWPAQPQVPLTHPQTGRGPSGTASPPGGCRQSPGGTATVCQGLGARFPAEPNRHGNDHRPGGASSRWSC